MLACSDIQMPRTPVMSMQAWIECEHPNASLYTFTGNLVLGPPILPVEAVCPLSQASMLLRGCSLRNTASILGMVVFTGHESKVSHLLRKQKLLGHLLEYILHIHSAHDSPLCQAARLILPLVILGPQSGSKSPLIDSWAIHAQTLTGHCMRRS